MRTKLFLLPALILAGLLLSAIPVFALQQTVGELISNISVGNSSIVKYEIKNDENVSAIVKFNITGTVSGFIEYPEELTLQPGQIAYIQLKITIPSDYSGVSQLSGIIYALKEGEKGGQVQINTQFAKKITVNVQKPKSINTVSSIILITIVLYGAMVLIKQKEVKPK